MKSWTTPTVIVFGGGLALLGFYVLRPRHAQAGELPPPGTTPGTTAPAAIPEARVVSQESLVRQPVPLPQIGRNAAADRAVFMIMQKQLKELGYRITKIDGIVGRETWSAMGTWARAKNFPLSIRGVSPQIITAIDADYGTSVPA